MSSNNPRIVGFDLIKTLAIFLVVFYHVGGIDYGEIVPGEYYIPNLSKVLSSFSAASVPLFFMVNGALVLPRHLSLKQLFLKSLKLIFLYIFGKVVLQHLLCQQLFGIHHEMVHFWFLLTLAAVYPISFFLDQYPYLKKIVLLLLIICPFLTNLIGDIATFFSLEIDSLHWVHTGLFTLYSLVYFYLGFQFRNSQVSTNASISLLFLGLLLVNFEVIAMSTHYAQVYDSGNAAFPTIGAACMAVGIFTSLKGIDVNSSSLGSVISFFGRSTMQIYMFHVLFLFWFRHFFPSLIETFSIFEIVLFVFILIVLSIFLGIAYKNSLYRIIEWYEPKV